jgi:dTDP-glucose 4,6-dehydratase
MIKQKTLDLSRFTRTLFVTGGAGFIGSNYLNKYVPRYPKYRFVNIDALTYAAKKTNINVASLANYVFEKADIRDAEKLEKLFVQYCPTGIIHFAAESHVDMSIKDPNIFIETNIIGTNNLLSLAKKYGVGRFHHISTDEVYGALKDKKGIFTEKSTIAPRNPYSASKAGADVMVMAYHETFGMDTIITRSSNNYGPNQDTTKLIPSFITKLLKGEQVPLYGNGENIRDWLYVEDNIDAIDLVFHKGKSGNVYNIGGNCELANITVVNKLLKLTGRGASSIRYVEDRLGHDFRYALSSEKLTKAFGWKPKVNFEKGIKQTFFFYKDILKK